MSGEDIICCAADTNSRSAYRALRLKRSYVIVLRLHALVLIPRMCGALCSVVRSSWCCISALLILFTVTRPASGEPALIKAYCGMNIGTHEYEFEVYAEGTQLSPKVFVPYIVLPPYLRTFRAWSIGTVIGSYFTLAMWSVRLVQWLSRPYPSVSQAKPVT